MPAKGYGMSRSICEVCGARGRHGQTTEISRKKDGVRRFVCNDHKCQRAWRYDPWKYVRKWTPFEQEAYRAKHGQHKAEQETDEMKRSPRISNEAKEVIDAAVWRPGVEHKHGFATELANRLKREHQSLLGPYKHHAVIQRILLTAKNGPPNYTPPPMAQPREVHLVPVVPVAPTAVPIGALQPTETVADLAGLAAQAQADLHKASREAESVPASVIFPEPNTDLRLDALFDIMVAQLQYLVICKRLDPLKTISSLLAEEVARA